MSYYLARIGGNLYLCYDNSTPLIKYYFIKFSNSALALKLKIENHTNNLVWRSSKESLKSLLESKALHESCSQLDCVDRVEIIYLNTTLNQLETAGCFFLKDDVKKEKESTGSYEKLFDNCRTIKLPPETKSIAKTEDDRAIFELLYRDKTIEEVSDILNLSVESIKERLSDKHFTNRISHIDPERFIPGFREKYCDKEDKFYCILGSGRFCIIDKGDGLLHYDFVDCSNIDEQTYKTYYFAELSTLVVKVLGCIANNETHIHKNPGNIVTIYFKNKIYPNSEAGYFTFHTKDFITDNKTKDDNVSLKDF